MPEHDSLVCGYFTSRTNAEQAKHRLVLAGFDKPGVNVVGNDELGPALPGTGPVDDASWLLATVTDGSDQQIERATKILKSYGGYV